jgi:hypothetical protein
VRSLRGRRRAASKPNAALLEAEELARAGHNLDAIDLLTAANREQRDGDVERRLVGLRNTSFEDLDPALGLASWPPDPGPDLFAGVSGLPEIPASALSADALRSGIVHHGALIVRGLVPPERVALLIDDIDRTFVARDAFFEGTPVTETVPWYEPFEPDRGTEAIGPIRKWVRGGGGVLTVESPRSMFDVLDTFDAAGLNGPLTEYLGERPVLSAKKWTLRRVPLDITADWHQDGAFLGNDIRAINVWVTLTHCGDDAPGLDVVGGRVNEIVTTGTEGAWFDWSVGDPVVREVARDLPILRPILEAGDAMLFDDLFLHRTAIEPEMTHERYAIESWFFAPSHYPHAQIPVTF